MSSQESSFSSAPPLDLDLNLPHHLPPSPPQSPKHRGSPPRLSSVDRIIRVLQLLRAGRILPADDSREIPLEPERFEVLERRIEEHTTLASFYDTLRWDYDAGTYTLRMPSLVHEVFTARVNDGIDAAISCVAERLGGTAKDALNGVKKGGSPTLRLSGPPPPSSSSQESGSEAEVLVETHRSPDGTFFHEQEKWPGVVLEVSVSQIGSKLDRIAESYIVDSFGEIRCVVGLELPYIREIGGELIDKRARVSVWRAKVETDTEGGSETLSCTREMDRVPFVNHCGVMQEGRLELRLAHLLPSGVLDTLDAGIRGERITIPFSDLAAYLRDANSAQELATKQLRPASTMKRKKRRRTPEEEMDEAREGKFQRLEDAEVTRQQKDDRGWKGNTRADSATGVPERRSARLSLRGSGAKSVEDSAAKAKHS